MKKLYFLLFIAVCTAYSSPAQTAGFANSDSLINFLSGGWKWNKTCGGLGAGCSYPVTAGFSQQLFFSRINGTSDSIAYQYLKNGAVLNQAHRLLSKDSTAFGLAWTIDSVSGLSSQDLIITFAMNDTLQLSDNCNDCYVYQFSRSAPVGIAALALGRQSLTIYPVPAHDRLSISGEATENTLVSIYSIEGQKVSEGLLIKEQQVDLSELPAGAYFIEMKLPQGYYRNKFLKN